MRTNDRTLNLCVAIAAALVTAMVMTGCGGGGGGTAAPSDTSKPVISNITYAPSTGSSETISAQVTDPGGISKVEVRATAPDGTKSTYNLTPKGGNLWSADIPVQPNLGTDTVTYKFTIYAYDNAGNWTSDGEYSFDVSAKEKPPAPPPFSVIR